MKITQLHITNFRLFHDADIKVGKRITVFSGTNSVGKSTLLGLLGHSSELKAEDAQPILQPRFRSEWSEIFKLSPRFDKTASNIANIIFDNGEKISYRITWQVNGTRGRIIPVSKDKDGKISSAKKSWPTLFLGLSRLYPLGEAILAEKESKSISLTTDILTTYKNILSINDNIFSTNEVHLSDVKKKVSVGINTDKYDYLTNSAGQDNLAQILLAVESFRELKKNTGDKYKGGLLLIDELDAALHPAAQNKLFDYLYKQCKTLDLQIAFTTHSLSLLEHIAYCTTDYPFNEQSENEIELYYFSLANNEPTPTIVRHPKQNLVHNLLLETVSFRKKIKVKVISEDKETRWFIKHILSPETLSQIDLVDTECGSESLISLIKGDSLYFNKVLVVLDGDVKRKASTMNIIKGLNATGNHILSLPDKYSPEDTLRNFLQLDDSYSNTYFSQPICLENGLTRTRFRQENLNDFLKRGKKRDKLKAWFRAYQNLFDDTQLYEQWKFTHQEDVDKFTENFCDELKKIANSLYIYKS